MYDSGEVSGLKSIVTLGIAVILYFISYNNRDK